MKNIINYISESQNFLVKGHTKKQENNKYEVYQDSWKDVYFKIETKNDLETLCSFCGVKQQYVDETCASMDEFLEDKMLIFIRPYVYGGIIKVTYIYYETERELKFDSVKQIGIANASDFNIDYYKKNKWSVK